MGGQKASEIFGGPLASMLEELKAQSSALYFAAGARLGAELRLTPLTPHLGLRVMGDLLATPSRVAIQIGAQPGWTTPRLAGDLGLGVVAFW